MSIHTIDQLLFRCIILTKMAPEVVVPANFGKHHLKSRSHSNLELLCDEGEIKRANSMILSLNSSVIDDLISRLDITSLDVQDFGAPAVGCFVESMYSGELEKCDKSNFRDLNKMGYVFNVSWFTERCLEYFTEHVDMLTGRCYEDVLFVVEEARFVEESQKKDNFTSLVEDKLNTMRNRKSMFLKRYSNDLGSISINQLKMAVKLAGSDVGILVHILVRHLKSTGATSFVETSRFLFKNIDFECCLANRRFYGITIELCDIFMEKFSEDFKSAITVLISKQLAEVSYNDDKIQYPVLTNVPAEEFLCYDIDACLEFLLSSDKVTNIHHLFDALYTWKHLWKDTDHETALVTHHQKIGAAMLTQAPGYLFKNIDFEMCFSNNRYFDITTKLFEILTGNCGDHFYFKNALESIARFSNKSNKEQKDPVVHRYPVMIDLSIKDLLHLDWDSLIELLAQSEKVCNLSQFFDAIFLWLHISNNDKTSSEPRLEFTKDHVKDIVDIKVDRCWNRISSKYLEEITEDRYLGTDMLKKSFLDSEELTCGDDGILFSSKDEYTIDSIFTEDLKITLVSDDKISACTEETNCAIMLQSTKVNETKPFSLTISHDVQVGCENFHFHYPSEATEIISLLVRLTSEGDIRLLPIPFNFLPCKIRSDRFWTWGFNSFLKHRKFSTDQFRRGYGHEKNTKVLFTAIFTG